jgi:anti-sigma-K factor RskA
VRPIERDHECPERTEAAAYALGALEEREAERYREHLEDCAVCRHELATLQVVVDALPAAAPPLTAPPAVRGRVMAEVRSEAQLLEAAGPQTAGHSVDRTPPKRRRWRLRPASVLAAAAAMAAGVAVGILAVDTGSGSQSSVRVTRAAVAPGVAAIAPDAAAVLRQSASASQIVVSNMPPPPRGRIYQVWVKHPNTPPAPTNALFSVTRAGSGSVDVPVSLQGAAAVMVTAEPLGGSPAPTSGPLITVTLANS